MQPEKLTRCPYCDGDETQCDFSKTEQCSQLSPTVNKVMRQSALRFYGPPSKH